MVETARAHLTTPRVPKVDWNGGDPVATHFFNALSYLFPRGERFFVEQARELGGDDPAVRDFGAQEAAIHAHQHAQYNAVLQAQGYENVSDELARRLQERAYRVFAPLTRPAVVCLRALHRGSRRLPPEDQEAARARRSADAARLGLARGGRPSTRACASISTAARAAAMCAAH